MNIRKSMAELAWVLGMILCPLGVCLCAKSGFGVSMIAAPPYILFLKLSQTIEWFTFGTAEYFIEGVLLIILCIIMRKFKWKYLLTFITAVLYGKILDLWYALFGEGQYSEMYLRVISLIAGLIITALAIAFFLKTYLPQEVYEVFVKDIVDKYHFNVTKVKWAFDGSMFIGAILLMLVLFRRFDFTMIGIGTVLATLVNAPLIGMWTKVLDKIFEFDPAAEKFSKWFDKIMN